MSFGPRARALGELFAQIVREGWASLTRHERRDAVAATRSSRLRARFLLSFLILGYGLIGFRLYTLQITEHEHWREVARRQHTRDRKIAPERGRLLLRDGDRTVPGAVSVERGSLLVYGRKDRKDPKGFLNKLEGLVGDLDLETEIRFEDSLRRGRSFYVMRRKLDREAMQRVRDARPRKAELHLPYTELQVEPVRAYPFGGLAAQVLGLTQDGKGSTGLERRFDRWLKGVPGREEIKLDNRGRELVSQDSVVQPAQPGLDLVLTIDRSIQAAVEDELARMAATHMPEGAAAVVVDPRTGDILAMASWPTYDPTKLGKDFMLGMANRAICHSYEPGSTIKPLFIGTAWQLGLGAWDRPIHCPRRLKVPRRRKSIEDSHTVGSVLEIDVLVQSSNTGAYQITSRMSPEQIRRALSAFGLGQVSGIDLAGELAGSTRSLAKLDPTTMGSVAQGYAITVTPLQMAMAYGALANGGTLYRPRLVMGLRDQNGNMVKSWEPRAVSRPLSGALTRGGMREALIRVVNDRKGTARRAKSRVYTVAGKTGTTKMLVDGRYHPREVVASFAGFAPAEDPRVAFAVVAWGPSTKKRRAWGGTVAAPCAGRIAERALRLLRVAPSPKNAK